MIKKKTYLYKFSKKIIIFLLPLILFTRKITTSSRIFIAFRVFLGLLFDFKNRITYIKRPLYSENVNRSSSKSYKNFAICFQGPVMDPFSFETIKIYKKTLPEVNIIFSTWNGIDNKIKMKLEELNVHLLLLDPPNTELSRKPGFRATSFQIKSTLAGLKYVNEKIGCEYSVKHRGDQRAYSSEWLFKLKTLQDTFPNNGNSITESKILLPSITCVKFRIYGIGDQFHFGKTKDLINFWDCPYYEDGLASLIVNHKNGIINGTAIISEIYLMAKFLEKNNHNLKWTLEDYWSVIKNNFCIFDCSYIDFVFFKENYSFGIQPNLYLEYREDERNYKSAYENNFNHADWIMLQNQNIKDMPWYNSTHELWENNTKEHYPPVFKCIQKGGINCK